MSIFGSFGVVAASHPLAAAVGMAAFEQGGNAFDAAFAAQWMLYLLQPERAGLGGASHLVLYRADRGQGLFIRGDGRWPAAADPLVPVNLVPGAVDAWLLLLRDHGKLPLATALGLVLDYARDGVPMSAALMTALTNTRGLRQHWPATAAVYFPQGQAPRVGRVLRHRALADTGRRLVAEALIASPDRDCQIEAARNIWASGFVAGAIERFCQRQHPNLNGEYAAAGLCGDDLVDWRADSGSLEGSALSTDATLARLAATMTAPIADSPTTNPPPLVANPPWCTEVVALDRQGNGIAASSIGGDCFSSVLIPELGFPLATALPANSSDALAWPLAPLLWRENGLLLLSATTVAEQRQRLHEWLALDKATAELAAAHPSAALAGQLGPWLFAAGDGAVGR